MATEPKVFTIDDIPIIHFGTAEDVPWRPEADEDPSNDDDDELQPETDPFIIAALGFDPLDYVEQEGSEPSDGQDPISAADASTSKHHKTAAERAHDRMTEPSICLVGEEVIWDGEAEAWGVPPETFVALPDPEPDDADT